MKMEVFSLLLKACGVSLIGCVCLSVVARLAPSFAFVLRVGALLALFGIVLYLLGESVGALWGLGSALLEGSIAYDTVGLMLKALGMALISKLCADVCRDTGESALASGVESVGKIAIFALAVPTFVKILELVFEMLGALEG
jgi:stage III sporulation protein AD